MAATGLWVAPCTCFTQLKRMWLQLLAMILVASEVLELTGMSGQLLPELCVQYEFTASLEPWLSALEPAAVYSVHFPPPKFSSRGKEGMSGGCWSHGSLKARVSILAAAVPPPFFSPAAELGVRGWGEKAGGDQTAANSGAA